MSLVEKILKQLEDLPEEEREKALKEIGVKYFNLPKDAFVVGDNYDFWLNQKDEAYENYDKYRK